MVDYKKFSQTIKAKYPQYKDVDDRELAEKIINKYPQYREKVTFNQTNEPIRPASKGFDITPSGIMHQISNAPVSAVESLITQKPFNEVQAKNIARQKELGGGLGKFNDFLVDTLVYSRIPGARVAKGTGLGATAANSALTGLGQGAVIGGLEGLKNEGVEGLLPGTAMGLAAGGVLGGGVPLALEGGSQVVKFVPKVGGLVSRTLGRVKPETLEQAVKPESQALDLTEKQAQNLLMNTTERVQNSYKNLLNQRGQEIENAIRNLPQDSGVPIQNLENQLDDIYSSYSISGNPELNVANNEAGGLYNRVLELLGKTNKSNKMRTDLDKRFSANANAMNAYNQQAENEAFDILHNATGKNTRWLKSQLKSDSNARGMGKRKEFIENELGKTDDRLDLNAVKNQYQNYDTNALAYENTYGNEAIGKGEEIARKAYDDILNRNFIQKDLSPLERGIIDAENSYNNVMKEVLNTTRADDELFNNATDRVLKVIKDLPEDVQNGYIQRLGQDLEDISRYKTYNANPTATAGEVKEILQNINETAPKTVWGTPAKSVENKIIKRLYGKYNNELSELSPELAEANRAYSALKDFEENEGIKSILRPKDIDPTKNLDSASRALRNYNSTVTKGNTNRNIQDLERLLVRNGERPFLNDIDDVNAAMDLLNIRGTGDSWLANLTTQLTRPALRGVRGYNRFVQRNNLQPLFNEINSQYPRYITPLIYGGGSSLYDALSE